MKQNVRFISICLLFALPVLAIAGKPPVTKWTVKKPFEQKVFVENKGQFSIPGENVSAGEVSYAAQLGGLNYYFTKSNIWITQYAGVKRGDAEIAELKQKIGHSLNSAQEKGIEYKSVEQFYQMNFTGANTSQITGSDEVSYYFTYGSTQANSIKAKAYKKIIYSNLYPGIDMEVYFPLDTTGFEYSFIVHPGADPSQIKIQYPLNKGISLDEHGNLIIKGDFCDFTEHLPVANQAESSHSIKCSFILNNGTLQIDPGHYNSGYTLKIDPWVNNSLSTYITAPGADAAWVVDWDNGSNCYAYGGGWHYVGTNVVGTPWQLMKFDPSGNELWTYSTTFTSQDGTQDFGDFAVDRYAKTIYIGEGFNKGGAQMVKLDAAGSVIHNYSNPNFVEMWRIAFSRCTPSQAVVGGGDIVDAPYNSAFVLNPGDSNLTGITPVNVLGLPAANNKNGFHDVCLLTLDDASPAPNAYMAFATSTSGSTFNNSLIKVPTPALTPIAWNTYDNYAFLVANSIEFDYGNGGNKTISNGFEGITYSELKDLYTYDSYKLERWNTVTGTIGGTKVVNTPTGAGNAFMHWSGIGSNTCNDVFLGTGTNIQEYDSSLATVGAPISEGDTVYSVRLGNYNLLYACGQNFVTVIQLNIPFCIPFSLDTTIRNATCTQLGSIDIKPQLGTAPYNYILRDSTGANTLATFTGLDSAKFTGLKQGTYIIDVTDTSCLAERIYETFVIKRIATYSPGLVTPNPAKVCEGSSVNLTGSLAVTYSWRSTTLGYPTGLSDSSGAIVTANPTVTTTYDFIARTPGDCPDTIKAVVDVNPLPTIVVSPDTPSFCTGGNVILTATGAVTYTWTPPGGLNPTTGATVTANPVVTSTYTVTGTDANNCVNDTTVVVSVYPYPVVTATPVDTICAGKSTVLLANGATTYTWTPSTGLSASTGASVTASPASSTTYTVSGSTHGCATTALDTVIVNPLPTVAITGLNPLYCVDAPAVVLNGGTPTGGTYSGTGVVYGADTTFNPATAGAGGLYTITYTYTSLIGCTNTGTTTVTVAPLPTLSILPANPVICSGLPITLTAEGASAYVWAPSGSTDSTTVVEITTPTRYLVTGTDVNGCVDTVSALVNIGLLPDTGFVMNVPSQCNSLSVVFVSTDTAISSTTYLWKFGDGTTSTAADPAHTFPHGGIDTVKLYETNAAGCEDSTIHYEAVTSPEQQAVFPNAFTPASTTENSKNPPMPQNTIFKPVINCNEASSYIFRVYNRWGQLVFSTNDENEGWDGNFNASPAEVGVYVYYMQFTCGSCPTERQGNVTLLR